jgi:hypothetical protein
MKIVNLTKLASLALALTGCGTAPPVTQKVEIPVFTPCVTVVPERPAFEFDKLPADATDGAKVLARARDWPRGRKYEAELEAIIAGCK